MIKKNGNFFVDGDNNVRVHIWEKEKKHKETNKLQSFLYTSGNIKTTKDSTHIHKAVNNKSKIHQWTLNLHGGAIWVPNSQILIYGSLNLYGKAIWVPSSRILIF